MRDLQSIAATLCVMVFACERLQDVERAGQWCDQYLAFCRRHGLQAQLALCRVQYASVLTARGCWDEADDQLAQALDGLRCRVGWSRPASERLGELRRRQGRLEEAEDSFERARLHELGILGKARVALDRGDHELALELAERSLRRLSGRGPIERIAPLELLVQVHCAREDVERAGYALAELESSATSLSTAGPRALVGHRRGQVALAAGDATTAKAHLEDALDLYESARLPFEAALVRLDLARALQAVDRRSSALDNCRTASEAFRALGATAHVATAEALMDLFAQADRPLPGAPAGLSVRELEVLGLLTRGLSNAEIAAELALSKHTIRRHVSNILTKLDLPSRTAAAVYALADRRP
jgi:ATP/maltotriose-dependent transcriptional regulator MalT